MLKKLAVISGWGFSPTIWNSFTENFSISPEFIYIDLLALCRPIQNRSLIETIHDELENRIPKDAYILGWSLGGLLALDFCTHHPEKSAALITIGSSPAFIAQDDWPGISPEKIAILTQQLDQHIDICAKRFTAEVLYPSRDRMIKNTLVQASSIDYNHRDILLVLLDLLTTLDLRNGFRSLTKPSLHLLGNQDALVPAGIADRLKKLNDNARVEVIENAGHAVFLTHPRICIDRIQNFLNLENVAAK